MALAMVLTYAALPTYAETEIVTDTSVTVNPIYATSNYGAKDAANFLGSAFDGVATTDWGRYFRPTATFAQSATKGDADNFYVIADLGAPYNLTQLYQKWGANYATGVAVYGADSKDAAEWTELADFTLASQETTNAISHTGYYRYIKVEAYSYTTSNNPAILEIGFEGVISPDYEKISATVISAPAHKDANVKENIADGTLSTWFASSLYNGANTAVTNCEIVLELERAIMLDRVSLFWGGLSWGHAVPDSYTLYVSSDGETYTAVGNQHTGLLADATEGTISEAENTSILGAAKSESTHRIAVSDYNIGAENVRYIKIAVNSYKYSFALSEVEIYTNNTIPVAVTPMYVTSDMALSSADLPAIKIVDGTAYASWGNYFKTAALAAGNGTTVLGNVVLDFGLRHNLTEIMFNMGSCNMKYGKLYGSNTTNDPTAAGWTELHTFDNLTYTMVNSADGSAGRINTQTVSHSGYYRYFKIEVTGLSQAGGLTWLESEFKGRKDSAATKIQLSSDNLVGQQGWGWTNNGAITAEASVLFDGELATNTKGYFANGYHSAENPVTGYYIELDLGDNYDDPLIVIQGGAGDYNYTHLYAYEIYTAGEDSVYGVNPVASQNFGTSVTAETKVRKDAVQIDAEAVRYVKIVPTYCLRRTVIGEIEVYVYDGSGVTEPEEPVIPEEPVDYNINLSLTGVYAPTAYQGYDKAKQTVGFAPFINATDGNPSTRYTSSTYNGSATDVTGYDMTFDLGMKTTLNTLTLCWGGTWGQVVPNSYVLSVSEDGETYTPFKTYTNLVNIALGLSEAPASEDTVYTSRLPSWITNPTASNDYYAYLDITENNMNLANVRYIKVTPTNFRYRVSLAEISARGIPNDNEKIMSMGGSICLPEGNEAFTTGLRFDAKAIKRALGIEENYVYSENVEKKFGMFLLPKDQLGDYETLTAYLAGGQSALNVPAQSGFEQDGDYLTFAAVYTDITQDNYSREIVAVPYMLKDGIYTYFEEMTDSYAAVAAEAREKQYTDYYAATRSTEAERERCRRIAYVLDGIAVGRAVDYTYVTTNTPTSTPATRYSTNALNLYNKLDNGINISTGTYDFVYSTSADNNAYQTMINDIKTRGFDHVRLPIDLRYYANEDGSLKTSGTYSFSKIDTYIQTAVDAGLVVTLDFHGWWNFSLFGGDDTRFINVWKNITTRYKDQYNDSLIFELMNEPRTSVTNAGADMNAKNLEELMVRTLDAIRAIDSDRVVAVALIDSNSTHQLTENHLFGSFRDSLLMNYTDVFVVAHSYAPTNWTRQNLSGNGAAVALTETGLNELRVEMKNIIDFQRETGVLVLLNEIGFNTVNIATADQQTYLQTLMDIIKPEGIPYTWWSYNNNITSGKFALMPNSGTYLLDILFDDYPTAQEKYFRVIDGVSYYDIKAASLSLPLSDYSEYFLEDAEGYYLDEDTFLVDKETFDLILSKPCAGTGAIKWSGYNKNLSFATSDVFDGVLPVDKMDDPLYVYMCKPSERATVMNRVNALNMASERAEHDHIIPIGAIYASSEKTIPDDAEVTICLGRMVLSTYTDADGWRLVQERTTPAKPSQIYYLPWELEHTLGSMTLPDSCVTLVDDHYEVKLTGAQLKGADKANLGATGSVLHFWGTMYELTEKFSIRGVAVGYECWVKEAEWAEYIVAAVGADWKVGSSVSEQVFAGHNYALTTEPRVIYGHNVGPNNYDNIMDTEKVQGFLQIN